MSLLKEGIENRSILPTTLTKKLSVDNHMQTYTVYKIRLDQLYYNDQNDRIATWISQYKAENGIIHIDIEDKEQYNQIIQGFITESNPEALKKHKTILNSLDNKRLGLF